MNPQNIKCLRPLMVLTRNPALSLDKVLVIAKWYGRESSEYPV